MHTATHHSTPALATGESARSKPAPGAQPRNSNEPPSGSFLAQIRPDRQHIHACSVEAIDSLFRRANNRFILIEAGIQQHRNSRLPLEAPNQFVIERI